MEAKNANPMNPDQPEQTQAQGTTTRDSIVAILEQHITSDIYFCTRVWEAWQVGTMTEDDFEQVNSDMDFINTLADALVAIQPPIAEQGLFTSAQVLVECPKCGYDFDGADHRQNCDYIQSQSTGVSAGEEVLVQSNEKTELHLIEMDELEINPRFVAYLKRVTIPAQGYSKEQVVLAIKEAISFGRNTIKKVEDIIPLVMPPTKD